MFFWNHLGYADPTSLFWHCLQAWGPATLDATQYGFGCPQRCELPPRTSPHKSLFRQHFASLIYSLPYRPSYLGIQLPARLHNLRTA